MVSRIKTASATRGLITMLVAMSLIVSVLAGCTPTEDATGLRYEDPELFLEEALERSGFAADLDIDFSAFDLSRFEGAPTAHHFSVRVDQADPSIIQLPGRPQIDLTLLADTDAGNFLVDFDITGAGPLSFKDNRIFISPDILALSAPGLFDFQRYITVNPNTFVDDWNASHFAIMLGEIDPGMIETMLSTFGDMDALFDYSAMAELSENHTAQFERLIENFAAAGKFRDGGNTEITIGEVTHSVARLGHYTSAEDVSNYANAMVDLLVELMFSYMDSMAAIMDAGADTGMSAQEMQSLLESSSFDFPAGMYLYYYVDLDTGLVLKSRIPDITVVISDGAGLEEEVSMEIVAYYLGENNPIDVTHMYMTSTDRFGNELIFELRLSVPKGGPYFMYMHMDARHDGMMTFELGFDPSAAEDNLWLQLESEGRQGHVSFDIRGDVVNTPEEFALSGGRITIVNDGITTLDASFEYSLRNIPAEYVSIDISQSTDLFEVNILQLAQILTRAMMMGMA